MGFEMPVFRGFLLLAEIVCTIYNYCKLFYKVIEPR